MKRLWIILLLSCMFTGCGKTMPVNEKTPTNSDQAELSPEEETSNLDQLETEASVDVKQLETVPEFTINEVPIDIHWTFGKFIKSPLATEITRISGGKRNPETLETELFEFNSIDDILETSGYIVSCQDAMVDFLFEFGYPDDLSKEEESQLELETLPLLRFETHGVTFSCSGVTNQSKNTDIMETLGATALWHDFVTDSVVYPYQVTNLGHLIFKPYADNTRINVIWTTDPEELWSYQ